MGDFFGADILEFWIADPKKCLWHSFKKIINLLWLLNNAISISSIK